MAVGVVRVRVRVGARVRVGVRGRVTVEIRASSEQVGVPRLVRRRALAMRRQAEQRTGRMEWA